MCDRMQMYNIVINKDAQYKKKCEHEQTTFFMFSVGGELSELVQGDESVFYICSK
jgi:hypothetical protein